MKHVNLIFNSSSIGSSRVGINASTAYLNISPAFVGIASAVASSISPSKVRSPNYSHLQRRIALTRIENSLFLGGGRRGSWGRCSKFI